MTPLRIVLAVAVLQVSAPAPGITGFVLGPDGSPVNTGTVALMMSSTSRVTAAIDRTGHFRLLPDSQGAQSLFISVPGHAPYRAYVNVPSSRAMALPDITLAEPTYFHVRFVTADGEPLAASGLRRRSIDMDGGLVADPLGHTREQSELDGSLTIGPLPGGRTQFAFDRAPFAQTRLRDVNVPGGNRVIEGGTIAIERGGQLHVDVFDAAERPVPRHEVFIDDAAAPSPLSFQPVRTNEHGRATFDRLASGRYRVFTKVPERCNGRELSISKLVTAGGGGASRTRLVIGGRAALRITSALGAMFGRSISLAPDAPADTPLQFRLPEMFRRAPRQPLPRNSPIGCGAVTDNDGRVLLAPFPPGPAQLRVGLFNSAYLLRLTVPENGGEIVIALPEGLLPVRVTDRVTNQPVAAQISWNGGRGRVEASTTANGDALVEAAGTAGGSLTITAREYQALEGGFEQTPDTLQEVALTPMPSSRVTVRVVDDAGGAVAGAVVQMLPRGAGDAPEFVAADVRGVAAFSDVPSGALLFSAHATGFKTAAVQVAEDRRASIVITLARPQ